MVAGRTAAEQTPPPEVEANTTELLFPAPLENEEIAKQPETDTKPSLEFEYELSVLHEEPVSYLQIEDLTGGLELDSPASELSSPLEEVEQFITLIAEQIKVLEEKPAEEISQILEQIAEKAAEVRFADETIEDVEFQEEEAQAALDVEEAKENIKELFVQLLNKLDIEYTSELVDCLVTLAVKYELKDFIKNDDKDTAVLQAAGTHEIIKHLFAALDSAKDMVAQACRIGRSVLQLCDPSLA